MSTTIVQAGPELDAEIARRVFGLDPHKDMFGDEVWIDFPDGTRHMPRYSSDLAAAWLVVEKMRERGAVMTMSVYSDGAIVYFNLGSYDWHATGDTAPHAICLAALAALDAE